LPYWATETPAIFGLVFCPLCNSAHAVGGRHLGFMKFVRLILVIFQLLLEEKKTIIVFTSNATKTFSVPSSYSTSVVNKLMNVNVGECMKLKVIQS
jgi:hypothetical protein